jgi:hypothetical protein
MPLTQAARDEMLRLSQLDYERTSQFIDAQIQMSSTIRGWAVTLWVAAVGFALDRHNSTLALIAAVSVIVLGLVDAYYWALYIQARDHGESLEQITSMYKRFLSRGDDSSRAEVEFDAKLVAYSFGLLQVLRSVEARHLLIAFRRPVYIALYLILPALALLVAALIPTLPSPSK